MTRTQHKRSTQSRESSSFSTTVENQLPLRARGLHVHDSHDQPDQQQHEQQHNSDQRVALIKKIENYHYLKIEPPFTDEWVGSQCATWANRHPVTRDFAEREQLSSLAYEGARNRYIYEIYDIYKCNPEQEYLAKKLGVSVRTVQRINKRFDEFDVIKIERRLDEESKKSMNFYILPG